MIKLLILISCFFLYGFTPHSKDELFLKPEEKEKAFECGKRYIHFLSNNYLFKKFDSEYKNICSCDDIEKLDRTRLYLYSNYLQTMTNFLAHGSVSCSQNLWLCINPTKTSEFESARNATEFCNLVDKKIEEDFKTPFQSKELFQAVLIAHPYYNSPRRNWGRMTCDILLPKANLDPNCKNRSGAGGASSQTIEEQLH